MKHRRNRSFIFNCCFNRLTNRKLNDDHRSRLKKKWRSANKNLKLRPVVAIDRHVSGWIRFDFVLNFSWFFVIFFGGVGSRGQRRPCGNFRRAERVQMAAPRRRPGHWRRRLATVRIFFLCVGRSSLLAFPAFLAFFVVSFIFSWVTLTKPKRSACQSVCVCETTCLHVVV